MSMFEIQIPDSVTFANTLADKIISACGLSVSRETLIQCVPELRHVDQLIAAAEHAYNDCLFARTDQIPFDAENLDATSSSLNDAVQTLTGQGCREYSILLDDHDEDVDEGLIIDTEAGYEEEDFEPEDDDEDRSEDGNQASHPEEE